MKKLILSLLTILSLSGLKAQTTVIDSFMFDGVYRNYRLYVPAVYNGNAAVPLVLNLHGYTSNAIQQEFYGNFKNIADTANFLVVHPNGTTLNGATFWNAFDLQGGVDDVGFLSALIDTIDANYNINLNRVYSTGMSNGGIMSYTLGCVLSNRIAAIASVTGTMVSGLSCTPVHPVPTMEIHGTADGTVPYEGGQGFDPIPTVLNYWVNFNNCNPVPDSSDVPNTNTTDNCTAKHYVWSGGDNGATVEHYKIIGGDHSWPGAIININTTNMDFSASREIWRFFSQYTLNGLTDINSQPVNQNFTVYPNPSSGDFNLLFADNAKRTVTLTNAVGQVVQRFSITDKQTVVSPTISGLYFVTVQQGHKVWSQKVVKY